MQEIGMSGPIEKIEIRLSKETIVEPGVIEFLVLNGRIPSFMLIESTNLGLDQAVEMSVYCEIPPPGTKFGDIRVRGISAGECEYRSPDGQSRGYSTIFELAPDRAAVLQRKVKQVHRLMDIPGEKPLERVRRKLGF
jgi:hypothetical protein